MNNSTKAIVLRTYKKDDSSLMVHCYTQLYGKQTFVLSSNYGRASQKAKALYFPLSLLTIEFTPFKASSLPQIKESSPSPLLHSLLTDFTKTAIAVFTAELLSKSIKEQEPDKALFQYLSTSIELFENLGNEADQFHILFMAGLCRYLGFEPRKNHNQTTPFYNFAKGEFVSQAEPGTAPAKISQELYRIFTSNLSSIDDFHFTKDQRAMLLKALVYYYQCHIPDFGEMKSLKVYADLF